MCSDEIDDDDAKIDELWTFHQITEEEEITEEQKKRKISQRGKEVAKTQKPCKKTLLRKAKFIINFPAETDQKS